MQVAVCHHLSNTKLLFLSACFAPVFCFLALFASDVDRLALVTVSLTSRSTRYISSSHSHTHAHEVTDTGTRLKKNTFQRNIAK